MMFDLINNETLLILGRAAVFTLLIAIWLGLMQFITNVLDDNLDKLEDEFDDEEKNKQYHKAFETIQCYIYRKEDDSKIRQDMISALEILEDFVNRVDKYL